MVTKATNSIWTDELKQRVIELHTTHSAKQISDLLVGEGIPATKNAVIGLWNRLGLRKLEKQPRCSTGYRATKRKPAPGVAGNIQVKKYTAPPQLRIVPLEPQHISVLDLKADSCRYPYGGDKDNEPITFCGHPKLENKSYCASHHALTYAPLPVRRGTPRPFFRTAMR